MFPVKVITSFELLYLFLQPFMPALYDQVRIRLRLLLRQMNLKTQPKILDVGGRKSHYTIGLPVELTISDLPRENAVQNLLHLGINESIIKQIISRRSNVKEIIYDDMTNSGLLPNSFDGIISIEVLEHVENDDEFLFHVHRILKPGGFFLMTTPNGDHIDNTNPDHKRHYKKVELQEKIEHFFCKADEISYIVADTKYHRIGLRSWNIKSPLMTFTAMVSNFINRQQSRKMELAIMADSTCHLVAIVTKQ